MIKNQKIIITAFLLLSTILYSLFGSIPKSHADIMREMAGHATCHDNHMENMVFDTPTQTLINHYDCCYQSYPLDKNATPKEFIRSEIQKNSLIQISSLNVSIPSPFLIDLSAKIHNSSGRAPPFHLILVGSVLQLK